MSADSKSDARDWLEEDTLPGDRGGTTPAAAPANVRDVRVLDFKDGRSHAAVSHGPTDPSRVWIALENTESYLHVSMEEGIARQIWEQLGEVLERFKQVRSDRYNQRLFP